MGSPRDPRPARLRRRGVAVHDEPCRRKLFGLFGTVFTILSLVSATLPS